MKSLHHSFDTDLASTYGLEEAIMIHHFQYWIHFNMKLKRNFRDGRTWSYQSMAEIAAHFPYWTFKQIRRILDSLMSKKVLIKGNFNKTQFDRTIWYAFAIEKDFLNKLYDCPNGQMETPKQANPIVQTGTPIPDPKPDAKQDPPPQTPPLPEEDFDKPTKEEEEEFLRILKNRKPNSPKIKCMKTWRHTVFKNMRFENAQKKLQSSISDCHKDEAEQYNKQTINGDLVSALKDRVEFSSGAFCRIVYYNISDSEWCEQTKIWFKNGNN